MTRTKYILGLCIVGETALMPTKTTCRIDALEYNFVDCNIMIMIMIMIMMIIMIIIIFYTDIK